MNYLVFLLEVTTTCRSRPFGFGECASTLANPQLFWLADSWQCEHQNVIRYQKVGIMLTNAEARATILREVLYDFGCELKQSTCVELICEVTRHPKYNSSAPNILGDPKIADQFAGELLEAAAEKDYEKFTQRMEEKYRVIYPEREFNNDIKGFDELGRYYRRELMGCIQCADRVGDDRYGNQVKYLWKVVFEKSEELLMVGIYHKAGVYYIGDADVL